MSKLCWACAVQGGTTLASAVFGGALRSEVKAAGAPASATLEPCFVVHLDIHPDAVRSVSDALHAFTSPETISGAHMHATGPACSLTDAAHISWTSCTKSWAVCYLPRSVHCRSADRATLARLLLIWLIGRTGRSISDQEPPISMEDQSQCLAVTSCGPMRTLVRDLLSVETSLSVPSVHRCLSREVCACAGYKVRDNSEGVTARKVVQLYALPRILVLHLKRFSYGLTGTGKIHKTVHYGDRLW